MHVQLFKGRGLRPWRFRLVGRNGEPMTRSQGYATKWNAKRGARRAHAGIPVREVTSPR